MRVITIKVRSPGCCMRKPSESIEDFKVSPAPAVAPEPPRAVFLRRTGEVEVVKPLTVSAERVQITFKGPRSRVPANPLWFRRFLAAGSGALVIIGLVLVSAILVGINDPAEVATNIMPNQDSTQTEELFSFDISSASPVTPATLGISIFRSNPKRVPIRPRVRLVVSKPKPQLRPIPQPEQPKFVPTTLVIYAENGVINTRIEPWIQFSN